MQQQVQAELERKQAAEEEREKAVQKQQQDIATLQQEVTSWLLCSLVWSSSVCISSIISLLLSLRKNARNFKYSTMPLW